MFGYRRQTLLGRDLWITLTLSFVAGAFLDYDNLIKVTATLTAAQAQLGPAILGVTVAGLAIFTIFLDRDYIELLEKRPPGVEADLYPFRWVAFWAAVTIVASLVLSYVAQLPSDYWMLFRFVFAASLWTFLYMLWNTYDLVRFLAAHARLRVEQIRNKERRP